MRRFCFVLILVVFSLWSLAQETTLPNKPDSVHFAVIGDSGTGERGQYEVADRMVQYLEKFPYDMVLMLGDNIYGSKKPQDYERKFELPYKRLLDRGVKFYASLGNHDEVNSTHYQFFNMNGERFYTFKAPKGDVRFFALDSNYMDTAQLAWLERELRNSKANWKICFFHHPLYSSGGRHGSDKELRVVLEPIFLKYGVNVVLTGHDHFYERIKPQKGIYYFVCGAAGRLAAGDIGRTGLTAKGFDRDNHFVLMEIAGDDLYFQTIARSGQTVDSGVLHRQKAKPEAAAIGLAPAAGTLQLRAAALAGR